MNVRAACILMMALAASVAAGAEQRSLGSAIAELEQRGQLTVRGEPICATRPLPRFYSRRNNEPAWFEGDVLRPEAGDLERAITRAAEHGLQPADYHLAAIQSMLPPAAGDKADLDLLLTDAFLLLGSHLLSGRVDPVSLEPTWCLEPRAFDLTAALESALASRTVTETLERLAPAHPGYARLREELSRLRGVEKEGGWVVVAAGPVLRKGDRGERVDQLIARLGLAGHDSFDVEVDRVLREFQALHGIDADGVAGRATLRELNVPLSGRIRQIELNLERWRWLPATLGQRYALINIPEFRLRVIEGTQTLLSMKIVVGKYYRQTPIFSSHITQVVLSPYWNVPDSIAWGELWPKAGRDPGFLKREHLEVLKGGRLRQTPGPWNSLGLLKFNIPNPYVVYLHDTPAKSLFDADVRAFSHGCIRIERPVDLAAYLLASKPEWPRERIVAESERGIECPIDVADPLAVHVLYWTAFVGEENALHFAPDVYHRDADLDRAMRRRPGRL